MTSPIPNGVRVWLAPAIWLPSATIDNAHGQGGYWLSARRVAGAGARHVGARGTAYWNVRLLDRLFGFNEIRVHSRRAERKGGR